VCSHAVIFCLDGSFFWSYSGLGQFVPIGKLLGVVLAVFLQDGCPFCCSTNSIKAMKDNGFPDGDSMLPPCCTLL